MYIYIYIYIYIYAFNMITETNESKIFRKHISCKC